MTNSEKRQPKRVDIYEEFILWSAMPPTERMRLGIETQEQFVEFYKIGINTPTAWKRRRDFEARVTALRKEWAFGKTSAVIEGIYRSAMKGNPFSQKLWLQYFEGFTEKQEVTNKYMPEVSPNDVRFIIAGLPEPLRYKFYGYIDEIVATIDEAQRQGTFEDAVWTPELEAPVPEDTSHYTPAVKEEQTEVPQKVRFSPQTCDQFANQMTCAGGHQSTW